MSELKNKTIGGIKWIVGSSFLQKGISLAATVVLARILGPAEFGLFALAFVAIDALSLFKSMGFDSALIQRKDDIEKAANTAFFIIPLLGIVLYLILAISAPWIGKFLNNQQVVGVIRALGIIFVLGCLGKVPAALLENNMQFKKVSIIEVGVAIVYAASAVIFALLKFGVWSLVIAYILKIVYQNVMFFIYAKWRPRFEFDKKIALEMFHFGKFIFLVAVVGFLKMNLDNLLVGKLLGVAALGYYAIAFNVGNFVADYFGSRAYRVVFPAYSKLQEDMYDLKIAALKTLKYTSIITLPFGIGISLLSGEFLGLVYGPKWLGASGILRILAWAGIFNTLPFSLQAAFLACGKSKLVFWITALQVALFFLFIAPMAKLFGINGVGWVVSFSGLVVFIITLILSARFLHLNIRELNDSFRPSVIASAVMTVGVIFLKFTLHYYYPAMLPQLTFIICLLLAIAIYGFSLFKIEGTLLGEIKKLAL